MLFIDARNYYTVVDRTLNEWSEWQLRNLQAIVHLYRGEQEKYQQLLRDYDQAIDEAVVALKEQAQPFSDLIDQDTRGHFWGLMGWIDNAGHDYTELRQRVDDQIRQTKMCMKSAESLINKRTVKAMRQEGEAFSAVLSEILKVIDEHDWLTEKFGDGKYQDVLGLCKVATIQEIEEKNYSLTPGAYVGVAEQEDDGVDFHERMTEIHDELNRLNTEANALMNDILKEWEGMQ